jgi:antitoxin (DNA-binding transcriptional repressor) of toxin-antitoxin stability system
MKYRRENEFDYSRDQGHIARVKTVSKGKLKGKMLEYFRQVELTGEPLIVTDRGREVLEVRPVAKPRMTVAEVLAEYRSGTRPVREVPEEELMEPLPLEDWEVLREDDRNPW